MGEHSSARALPGARRLGARGVQVVRPQAREHGIEALFQRHHEAVWRFALRMSGDMDTARDLAQEAFLRALEHRVPDDDAAARSWLMRTVLNLCRDRHRRWKVRLRHREQTRAAKDTPTTTDPEAESVARESVDRALAGLSPRRRAILVLHELEGLTTEEIGRQLALKQPTVRWHLAAAKRHVRHQLSAGAPGEAHHG